MESSVHHQGCDSFNVSQSELYASSLDVASLEILIHKLTGMYNSKLEIAQREYRIQNMIDWM